MPKPKSIAPDDLRVLEHLHNSYLADNDSLTTSAKQLQDDAYRIGYQRAVCDTKTGDMQRLLAQINQAHGSGLPRSTRLRIAELLSQ